MNEMHFRLRSEDGVELFVYCWGGARPRGVVQIAHGMGEHAGRYARLARNLVGAGYRVYAGDHRGHGRSVAHADDLGVFAETDGWNRLVADVVALTRRIHSDTPDLPIVLLGHSMGSFAAQQILVESAEDLTGVVLSGSTSFEDLRSVIEQIRPDVRRLGHRARFETPGGIDFAALNAAFEPQRTDFDWLSRDEAEVDAYVADPLCGFTASAQATLELYEAMQRLLETEALPGIPSDLPVYIFAGDRDPVNAGLEGLRRLIERYLAAGLRDVSWRFYPGGRHEMLNETNRDEVTRHLVAWLDRVVRG